MLNTTLTKIAHMSSPHMLSKSCEHATPFVMGQLSVESRQRVCLKGCSVKEIHQGLKGENIAEVTMQVP